MLSDDDFLNKILEIAEDDVRIRAVVLNGSRTCKSVKKDRYQDFDIVYITTDLQFFIENRNWIDCFGERIILEMPWYKDFSPEQYDGQFNYQILLKTGYRIDLTFAAPDKIDHLMKIDPVGVLLLDKDGLLHNAVFAGEDIYFVQPPAKKEFEDTCNSFWWVLQNIAKGIKRNELPYAMQMLYYGREELHKIMSWYIGLQHDFKVSTGKMGKYFERYLDAVHWDLYKQTYPAAGYESMWHAVFTACALFREYAVYIAESFSYTYPSADDQAMSEYLHMVKDL